MSIDYSGHQLQIGENPIVLSRMEFAIVDIYCLNAGQVLFDQGTCRLGLEAGSSDTVMEHIRKCIRDIFYYSTLKPSG